jgi:dolichyl-phosphate beta-glucosyltransferase
MILSLSIIIPAYNEEKVISDTLTELQRGLKQFNLTHEILVVNDGSTDATSKEVRKFEEVKLIEIAGNLGKGNAVKVGVQKAKMDHVLFIDADHAVDISNLNNFLPHVNTNDIIIGSKYINSSSAYPFHRKIIGKTFSAIRTVITGLSLKDTQCGFKLYKTIAAKKLFKRSIIKGWCFDVEILMLAKTEEITVKEIAVNVKSSDRVSRINVLSSGFQMLFDLLKLKINFIQGKYKT